MENQNEHRIELQDEEGNGIPFEHLMTLKHEGSDYILLEAVEDMEDCMKGEAIILKITQDEDGEDMYVTIDDGDELQAVFDQFIAAMDEQDTMDEEDYDEDEQDEE